MGIELMHSFNTGKTMHSAMIPVDTCQWLIFLISNQLLMEVSKAILWINLFLGVNSNE